MRGDLQCLDLPRQHPLGRHGTVNDIGTVFGEQHPARDLAHLMPGPADALQSARHRGWSLDLDHQIHRTHIDSEFEAAGGHHTAQPAALQIILDQRPLLLAHRPVVRPRQQLFGTVVDLGGRPQLGGWGCAVSTDSPSRSA